MSAIQLFGAQKYYNKGKSNELHVIDNVNLELPERGMVAVFGKSGCGKTTLLNAIGGLDRINSGKISLFGKELGKNADRLRNRYIGYIFQNYNLNKNETVFENVADALRLCGMRDAEEIRQRVTDALAGVGIEKFRDRFPDTLSGGQQQRVAIARAIVKDPAVILADEPTGNLDEANTVTVMDILKELSRTRLVLLVTHEANLVDYYCDRVIEIVDGAVKSDRVNPDANGYVKRDKNDIYLGELPVKKVSAPGVKIAYYGEPDREIRLRIVNVGGKIYLKTETPDVHFLDESAEVKLLDGKFESSPQGKPDGHRKTAFRAPAPFKGKHYGRLYTPGTALALAWRENFSGQKRKGKRLLRVCMFLLSMVLVFLSASEAVCVREYVEAREDHHPDLFYLPVTWEGDYSAICSHVGENGIDYVRLTGRDYAQPTPFPFQPGYFMTASVDDLETSGVILDASLASGLKLLAGTDRIGSAEDMIITSAAADDLIRSSTVSYIKDYGDLLGLCARFGNNHPRIVGVVESDEKNFFFEKTFAARVILTLSLGSKPFMNSSDLPAYEKEIPDGQLVYFSPATDPKTVRPGDTLTLMGRKMTVADVVLCYELFDENSFFNYMADAHSKKDFGFDAWYNSLPQAEREADGVILESRYYFDYYLPYWFEFARVVALSNETCFSDWYTDPVATVLSTDPDPLNFLVLQHEDPYLYESYLHHQETGSYLTTEEAYSAAYRRAWKMKYGEDFKGSVPAEFAGYDFLCEVFFEYCKKESSALFTSVESSGKTSAKLWAPFLMNDRTFCEMAGCAGASDPIFGLDGFGKTEYTSGSLITTVYDNYLLIHASDPAQARAYLTSCFGDDLILPEDVFANVLKDSRRSIIISATVLAIVLFLMCLCIFFIMRSSFMSRVREVGIMRAIGVSKRNLTYRFAVEAFLLTTATTVIGYLFTWWLMHSMEKIPLFSMAFYFPTWLALIMLAVLYAASILFGIIPARMLLRRSPSEILSKYDI